MQTIYHALAALNDLYYDVSFEKYQEARQDLEEQVKRELPGFTIDHAQILRERFTSGLLSQFRPLRHSAICQDKEQNEDRSDHAIHRPYGESRYNKDDQQNLE